MFSKIIFYTLLHATFVTIASQHDHAVLFTQIEKAQSKIHPEKRIIMVLHATPALDLPPNFVTNLNFRQTDQGILLALHRGQQQALGRWPNRMIQTAMANISEEKGSPTLQIKMPYIPIIRTPA